MLRYLRELFRYSTIAQNACSGTQFRKCVKKVARDMMLRAEVCKSFHLCYVIVNRAIN